MSDISPALKRKVVERASNRCEYCQLSQVWQEATFHIDHVIPRAAGGQTEFDNLALACVSCSLHKAANLEVIDSATNLPATIFNPRLQVWNEHFRWDGNVLMPSSPVGRVTIQQLAMNRPLILAIRSEEALRVRHPPV